MADNLRVIPLGGLGEIGKNMMVLELADDLILVDAGLMFPDEEMLGVDLVIPDVSYVTERISKLRGVLITHGHEDHTGALPYVLPRLRLPNGKMPPIYCTRLTRGLIAVKLEEHRLDKQADLRVVRPGERVKLGRFNAEFIHITHSIPDSAALAIQTPAGTVFHTGDFKFDHTPVMGEPPDLTRIAEIGRQGVALLFSDSTYADTTGYTPSERSVSETLDRIMANASGRVIVATFASLISRIQQVIDAATKHDRRVFITGRSMLDNVKMAIDQGYLSATGDVLASLDKMKKLAPEKIAIITTGAQGEPTSALVRMANRDHRHIEIQPGDTVVLSSSPIPGNELLINRTIDNLYRQGAEVLFSRIASVHVRGHAAQEELKLMIGLVKPRYFVPVHGEYRHLWMHSMIARSMGLPAENVFTLEDGDILELDAKGARVAGRTSADWVYVDGLAVGIDRIVLRDRAHLAGDGVIVAIVAIDRQTGKPIGRPDVVSRGFIESEMSDGLMERAKDVVVQALGGGAHVANKADFNTRVHDALSRFLFEETRRRPMVLPVSVEV
ncbi:MAG: ribonuclease J [Chloroflexi bacterium]|jgi:ribonuclease J|nr:MAG: ribonuclease J [Chloroflexota bacterium]